MMQVMSTRRRCYSRLCRLGFVALAGLAGHASAQIETPSWRGSEGSTWQEWHFLTNSNPAGPEFYSNSIGLASASVSTGGFASGWVWDLFSFGTATGYWDLGQSGSIDLSIPDYGGPTLTGLKDVRVQVVQWIEGSFYSLYAGVSIPEATLISRTNRLYEQTGFGAWRVDDWHFQIPDETPSDLVAILGATGGTIIDLIVIDTLTIPEPSALLVCAAACGIGLLARRRMRPRG